MEYHSLGLRLTNLNDTFETKYFVLETKLFSANKILKNAETAYKTGKRVVLNSVPDRKVQRKLLRYIYIAIFDEEQLGELTKVEIKDLESAKMAVLKLYGRGAEIVVIKMKTEEVLIFADEVFTFIQLSSRSFSAVFNGDFVEIHRLLEVS